MQLASRRSIRSRSDLCLYVARMTIYIVIMASLISISQTWAASPERMLWALLGSGTAAALLSLPITWEFGRMYLDLWDATQSLRDLARTDQQTGLYNNRSFIEAVEERLALGRRIALVLGDLDRFKAVNDLHGHQSGDEVIARVGAEMRALFGDGAVIGRMGGEEFAAAIDCPFGDPEMARNHVATFAEELRRRIAAIRIPSEAGTIAPTISIGIARSEVPRGFSALYGRADKALYVAKAAGRNRVVDQDDVDLGDAARLTRLRDDIDRRESGEQLQAVRWL
ncbi:GGDEF domain-containing protein [Siculibacillus lacustris]|uniref:diguanylate cyclase n=1 Tax=Siculibacillus lacustris TaxID=1549641 RepID=A0A4Q9VHG5_9HYPH|nr:GGDEF domain-containing protein [Siculibacillus lacustris]TBW34299.1 GGDEF domain-containing protein [Siculibacillus lacustris]